MTDSFITLASLSGMLMLLIRDTVRPDYVFLGGLTVFTGHRGSDTATSL